MHGKARRRRLNAALLCADASGLQATIDRYAGMGGMGAVTQADVKPNTCINIWRYDDAPAKYKALSTHGGDEDWIVFIPANIDYCPLTIDADYVPGWGHTDSHDVADGTVIIFAHA